MTWWQPSKSWHFDVLNICDKSHNPPKKLHWFLHPDEGDNLIDWLTTHHSEGWRKLDLRNYDGESHDERLMIINISLRDHPNGFPNEYYNHILRILSGVVITTILERTIVVLSDFYPIITKIPLDFWSIREIKMNGFARHINLLSDKSFKSLRVMVNQGIGYNPSRIEKDPEVKESDFLKNILIQIACHRDLPEIIRSMVRKITPPFRNRVMYFDFIGNKFVEEIDILEYKYDARYKFPDYLNEPGNEISLLCDDYRCYQRIRNEMDILTKFSSIMIDERMHLLVFYFYTVTVLRFRLSQKLSFDLDRLTVISGRSLLAMFNMTCDNKLLLEKVSNSFDNYTHGLFSHRDEIINAYMEFYITNDDPRSQFDIDTSSIVQDHHEIRSRPGQYGYRLTSIFPKVEGSLIEKIVQRIKANDLRSLDYLLRRYPLCRPTKKSYFDLDILNRSIIGKDAIPRSERIDNNIHIMSTDLTYLENIGRIIKLRKDNGLMGCFVTEKRIKFTYEQRVWLWDQQFGRNFDTRCSCCGCAIIWTEFHVAHITALSRGGSNMPDNLTITCMMCNLSMNTENFHDFQKKFFPLEYERSQMNLRPPLDLNFYQRLSS